jgi:hypothetical protein
MAKITRTDIKAAIKERAAAKNEGTWIGFDKLKAKLGEGGRVKNPGALAAFIGRKKFGKKHFQALAKAGRRD